MSSSVCFFSDFLVTDSFSDLRVSERFCNFASANDYNFVNLEAPICKSNLALLPKAGPSFKQGEHVFRFLRDLNISHLCLANNHIFDYGKSGVAETVDSVKGISCLGFEFGADLYEPVKLVVGHFDIAVFNVCERQFGCAFSDEIDGFSYIFSSKFDAALKSARDNFDYIIVVSHTGLEGVSLPLPQWRKRYHEILALGADVVINHHPHVRQGFEVVGGKRIYYSLGNFLFKDFASSDGFFVSVNFDGDELSFSEFELIFSNGVLDFQPVRIQDISEYLNSDLYFSDVDNMCLTIFRDRYVEMFNYSMDGFRFGSSFNVRLWAALKNFWKNIFRRNNHVMKDVVLYHLICFDTHRFVCDIALRSRAKVF